MKYRIQLTHRKSKEHAEVTVPADMTLEEFSAHIKVALELPYVDLQWHRFQAYGVNYMAGVMSGVDEEIRGECDLPIPDQYGDSLTTTLSEVFTTIHSTIAYAQEESVGPDIKVTCTLLERIEDAPSEERGILSSARRE